MPVRVQAGHAELAGDHAGLTGVVWGLQGTAQGLQAGALDPGGGRRRAGIADADRRDCGNPGGTEQGLRRERGVWGEDGRGHASPKVWTPSLQTYRVVEIIKEH